MHIVRRIRFYINHEKPQAEAEYARLRGLLRSVDLEECADGSPDAVVVLGGDGTLLRAVHEFPGVPVLGLNLGGLGYLASVEGKDFERALGLLAKGAFQISERRLLAVNGRFPALNDIVITRELTGHSTRLDLEADGRRVTSFLADGLIFATPTGSTAYSLAAGGPVLMPDSDCFVMTPMNPHALSVRPLVVRDSVRFKVTVQPRAGGNRVKIGVYSDGEPVMELGAGMSLEIAKSPRTARLVELDGYEPYGVLARKLGWSGSNVK